MAMGTNGKPADLDALLEGVDLEGVIKKTIKRELPHEVEAPPAVVDEAYVAQAKPYAQTTEFASQKTKDAHELLYKGYVETLNRVSSELDTAERSKADNKHSDYRSLKLDETYNLNSVWLHELFFANCFDPHSEVTMDSMAYLRLERDFGTFDDWQMDFMACALASGQGWAVCGYNMYLQRYVNTMISCHSQDVQLGFYPLVVVDMWEHSYFKDYQTDKKSYLIAMMREFNWDVINERFKKAEEIAQVLGSGQKRSS